MRRTLLQLTSILGLSLVVGTIYNLARDQLEFFVKPDRYANNFQCRKVGAGEESGVGRDVPKPTQAAREDGFPRLEYEAVREAWAEGLLFIDARPSDDYEEGHIPGAVSLPAFGSGIEEEIERLVETEPTAAPVIIYCNSSEECEASHIVSTHLRNFEFLDVKIYSGGFPEWKEKKAPVHEGEDAGPRGPSGERDGEAGS